MQQMSSRDGDEAREGSRKRFEAHQVEVLKSVFRDCPNPDESKRIELSRRLGLTPQQIKFWFQNQRTHIKAKIEKLSNNSLCAEIDKIRCETIEIQKAFGNCLCSKCGIQLCSQDKEEQCLRLNDERVKTKIDQCMRIITNHLGRSFAEMSLMQYSLDQTSTTEPRDISYNPSLDIDVLPNNSFMNVLQPAHPFNTPISNRDKSLLIEQATNAMNELVLLVQPTDELWFKPMHQDKEILDLRNYRKIFKMIDHHFPDPNIRVEASRASGLVYLNMLALVDMFMDPAKWTDLFQTVVSKAKTIDVLSVGMGGNNHSGSLLLMHSEIGVPSLIPSRVYYFVRYCQKVKNGFWYITDVSVHLPGYCPKNRRLPSGCLIQEMPNGYSLVTWVEHLEVEETNQNYGVFQSYVKSNTAFGAQRWLTTLQRRSERFHYLLTLHDMDVGGVITTQESKLSLMTLSNSMVKSFCDSLCPTNAFRQWITLLNDNDIQIRVLPQNNVVGPSGIIVNAITSTWLPFSTERIFSFFKDVSKRDLWDILSIGHVVQPISNFYTGSNVGNCVSLLRSVNSDQNPVMLLQETCTDSSISMLVYASVDNPTMEIVITGGCTSSISLLSSGVAIIPNCNSLVSMGPSSSSNPTIPGSFITLSFQIVMTNQPTANLDPETVAGVSTMMLNAVNNVKNALNFP